jgi:hypothetical protein
MEELQIQIEQIKIALIHLASCVENGSWQGVTAQVAELLRDEDVTEDK